MRISFISTVTWHCSGGNRAQLNERKTEELYSLEEKVKLPVFGEKMIVYLVSELTKRQLQSLSKFGNAPEYKINKHN